MKKRFNLLLALLLPAALCLPVFAEDAAAPAGETAAAEGHEHAAKKPAPKKKAKKKKKKAAPVSEYKFNAVDKTETYKFDRKANPILKPAKKKAAPKKAAPKPAPESVGVGGDASGAAPDVN